MEILHTVHLELKLCCALVSSPPPPLGMDPPLAVRYGTEIGGAG